MKAEYVITSGTKVYPAEWPTPSGRDIKIPNPQCTKYTWKFINTDILLEVNGFWTLRLPGYPKCNEEGYNCFSVHRQDALLLHTDAEDS